MWELLQKLEDLGWKPYGKSIAELTETEKNIRLLTSLSSGLWQFVCDRGLIGMYEGFYWQNIFPLDSKEYDYTDYQYWILESSLIDVDKLEGFILDNIKI